MKRLFTTAAALALMTPLAVGVQAETVLRVDEVAVGELDPSKAIDVADSVLLYNVYDTLVFPDLTGQGRGMVNHLAQKIDVVGDNVYRITVRDGVKFHSGNTLDAHDVVYSLKRMSALGRGFSYLFGTWVKSVEAENDKTAVVTLKAPYAAFFTAMVRLGIIDSDTAKAHQEAGDYGEFGDYSQKWLTANDAGTGAYRVEVPRSAAVDGYAQVSRLLWDNECQGARRGAAALRLEGSDPADPDEPRRARHRQPVGGTGDQEGHGRSQGGDRP